MATLDELMTSATNLRDALYARLDDNISDRSFELLRFRHAQAVMEVRRTGLADPSPAYDPVIVLLDQATAVVSTASNSDGDVLVAANEAGKALDEMIRL